MSHHIPLGALAAPDAVRDAVHVALAPVICGRYPLDPGDSITVNRDGIAVTAHYDDRCGIVDPFLKRGPRPGERFFIVLNPGTITSMRHLWQAPGFPDETPAPREVEDHQSPGMNACCPDDRMEASPRAVSEAWMKAWAMRHMSCDCYGDYEKPLPEDRAYANAIEAGRNNSVGPYESARDHIDATWWDHWETITGEKGDRETYFSCAC